MQNIFINVSMYTCFAQIYFYHNCNSTKYDKDYEDYKVHKGATFSKIIVLEI